MTRKTRTWPAELAGAKSVDMTYWEGVWEIRVTWQDSFQKLELRAQSKWFNDALQAVIKDKKHVDDEMTMSLDS